jgi:hypothetical protein
MDIDRAYLEDRRDAVSPIDVTKRWLETVSDGELKYVGCGAACRCGHLAAMEA